MALLDVPGISLLHNNLALNVKIHSSSRQGLPSNDRLWLGVIRLLTSMSRRDWDINNGGGSP